MSVRFEERRRAEQRRRWLRIGVALVVVASAIGLAWTVWFSSLLTVEKVEVKGLETIKQRDLLIAANVPVGEHLARVDTDLIQARVAKIRRVEQVEIDRSWPHTLTITVVEREAVAITGLPGSWRGVDRYGIEFRTFTNKPKLPEVRVLTVDPRRRQQAFETLAQVITDLKKLYPDLLAMTTYIEAESRDSVELHLTKRRTVVWGSEAEPADKVKVLRALLKSVRATQYNVSAPEQPTTRG